MKITELSIQKKNPNRFNLYVNGRFYCGVSTIAVAKWGLHKSKEIDESTLEKILENELYLRFLDRAVTSLSSSFKTERRVRQYLREVQYKKKDKWFSEDNNHDFDKIFEKVITQLVKVGYIDDKRYSEMFVSSRMNSKPRSKSVLVSELIGKGVNREIAKEAVEQSGADNEDLIRNVYKKRFKKDAFSVEDRKKVDFLRRKGFNWDEITKLERNLKDDTRK